MAASAFVLATSLPSASANPTNSTDLLPELEIIKAIADMFSSFCSASPELCQGLAAGGDEETGRRLGDDASTPYRMLEGQVQKLASLSPSARRGLTCDSDCQDFIEDVIICALETLACHLYLDNLFLPPLEDYVINDVCLSDPGEEHNCEEFYEVKEIEFTADSNDIKANEFLYQDSGPLQTQGVFALEYDPCSASSLVSFGETREAPGGVGTGEIGDINQFGTSTEGNPGAVGPLRFPTDYAYAFRVIGDHNWAFGKSAPAVGSGHFWVHLGIFDVSQN